VTKSSQFQPQNAPTSRLAAAPTRWGGELLQRPPDTLAGFRGWKNIREDKEEEGQRKRKGTGRGEWTRGGTSPPTTPQSEF